MYLVLGPIEELEERLGGLTEEVTVAIGGKVGDADNDCCTGPIDIVSRRSTET